MASALPNEAEPKPEIININEDDVISFLIYFLIS